MRAILVSLALVVCLGAGRAYADPIHLTVHSGPSSASSDMSLKGNTLCVELAFSLSSPVFLMVHGLDGRDNYQAMVQQAALKTSHRPGSTPSSFSNWTDYDGSSVSQGSRLERSFLASGTSGFGTQGAPGIPPGQQTFNGSSNAVAVLLFGPHDFDNGRRFFLRLANGDPVATPEPGAMLLIGTGLLAIARMARKRRSQA